MVAFSSFSLNSTPKFYHFKRYLCLGLFGLPTIVRSIKFASIAELLKAGYPPCIITVENRLTYYEALDQWMAYGKTEAFVQLVSEAVLEGFKPYQVVLGI